MLLEYITQHSELNLNKIPIAFYYSVLLPNEISQLYLMRAFQYSRAFAALDESHPKLSKLADK